jgi:hypothetical protein
MTELLPKTVAQAVDFIIARLEPEDIDNFLKHAKKKSDVIMFHHGFGTWVRNELGLWSGNDELLKATKRIHPDDASGVILEALWTRLTKERKKGGARK